MKVLEGKPVSVSPGNQLEALVREIEVYQSEIAEHRRKLEKVRDQLRHSYSRYNELFEMAPVAFLALDRQGRVCEVNAKGGSLLGSENGSLIGQPFLMFISSPDIQRFVDLMLRSTRTQQQENLELVLDVNGHPTPVHISMRTAATEDGVMHRMTIVDLSDVKRNERQLRSSLDSWLTLVKSAPDVLLTIDRAGTILFANRPLWGHVAESLIGTRILNHVPEKERSVLEACLHRVFHSGKRQVCEVAGLGGVAESWHEFSFGPIQKLKFREAKTTTTQIRDITEEKKSKERLRLSGEQLREFAAGIEAVREEERARVAREIHDELGQALTILKLDLSWLQGKPQQDPREFRKKVKSMMDHVDKTIETMRKIVSELRPSMLDDLGLIPAIEWQVKEFQKRTGIRTQLRTKVEEADITSERSAAVFRVVQEALTNVMRHANAKRVQVDLKKEKGLLKISVSDDGQGMTDDVITNMKSLGIAGMRERTFRIGGDFKIQSTPGSGTRVEIVLGLNNDQRSSNR
jgi:PAS domain S-box-containing protein